MSCRVKSKAEKVYQTRLLQTMALYAVVVLCTAYLAKHGNMNRWELYLLAVIPCLPVVRLIHVLALYLHEETDEFLRLLVVRSILCGAAAMLIAVAYSDFLRSYAKLGAPVPFALFTVFWVVFGLAQGLQERTNRVGGDDEPA